MGKTTLTATAAVALHRLGWRVLAIDFDRQNALQLHFELPNEGAPGIADAVESGRDWTDLVVETRGGIYLIPFGTVSATSCLRVQNHVDRNPGWIRSQLEPFFEHRDVVVVADMPPGPSPYNVEVDPVTDLQMIVLLADAVSLALVPKLQSGDYLIDGAAERLAQTGYVLNQVEPQRQLCSDVIALSQEVLGPDLFGQVHRDEAVAEAVACQSTVLDYAPDSIAGRDIAALAQRMHECLALG